MVTTVRQILIDAVEQIGAKDAGENLEAGYGAQGLRIYQNMVLNLPGMRWWNEVEASANYTAGENERVRVIVDTAVSITVPVAVSSAQKVLFCCNQIELKCSGYDDRAPKDGARVHVSDAFSDSAFTYFYRGDIAQWTQANALTLDSEVPLSSEWDEGSAAMLAARWARYFGVPLDPVTGALAISTESRMRARFGKRQQMAVDLTLLRTSSNNVWDTQ